MAQSQRALLAVICCPLRGVCGGQYLPVTKLVAAVSQSHGTGGQGVVAKATLPQAAPCCPPGYLRRCTAPRRAVVAFAPASQR